MRKLNHNNKNLLKFYEVHQTSKSIYVIVEYLDGKDLIETLEGQPVPSEKIVSSVLYGLLESIEGLHK
jgi:serine/threonine protein kinase